MKWIFSLVMVSVIIIPLFTVVYKPKALASTADGLMGYWNFDEDSGNAAHDSSGNGNDGAVNGATWVTGEQGSALDFNGLNSLVRVENSPSLQIADSITVMAWVKLSALTGTYEVICTRWYGPNGEYLGTKSFVLEFLPNSRTPWFKLHNSAGTEASAISNTSVTLDEWTYVAGTYDGSSIEIYVDGVLTGITPFSGSISADTTPFLVGGHTQSLGNDRNWFDGAIDEVKIYNYARSADQIAQDYQSFAGPVGYWKFDEGSGSIAHDSSGNGQDGSVYGGSWTEGISDKALQFDGVDDYVEVPSNPALSGFTQLTLQAWIKLDSFSDLQRHIISKSDGVVLPNSNSEYGLFIIDQNLYLYITSGTEFLVLGEAINVLNDLGTWYHVAGTWDGTDYALYVNGVQVVHGTGISGSITVGSTPLQIGRCGTFSWTYFDGTIDEVRIYNYARTSEEISEDYASLAPVSLPWRDDFNYNSLTEMRDAGWMLDPGDLFSVGSGELTLGNWGAGPSAWWTHFSTGISDYRVEICVKWTSGLYGSFYMTLQTDRHTYSFGGDGYYPNFVYSRDSSSQRLGGYNPSMNTWMTFTFEKNGSAINLYWNGDLIKTDSEPDPTSSLIQVSFTSGYMSTNKIDYVSVISPTVTSESYIAVHSEFSGYFLENLSFSNTFGVYTSLLGTRPISVCGLLDGSYYSFSNPSEPSGSYNLAIDMGSLKPNSTLEVFAAYPSGTVLKTSYPIEIVEIPPWLASIIDVFRERNIQKTTYGAWDNGYIVNLEGELDLKDIFKVNIPLPEFAGGGNYALLPKVGIEFSFSSAGTFEMSSSLTLETPEIDFGAASMTANVRVSASGEFDLQDNTVTWVSATVSLGVGSSASANIPIVGYGFDIPVVGYVQIGLSATVTLDVNFAVNMILAPTQNASQELISGIEIMIQSITGQISFGLRLAINAGLGIAYVTGEGDLDFTMYLEAVQPYISGGIVTGTVSIKYTALIWTGTIWSTTGTLYQWGSDPGDPDPSNFTVIPRYYDTSGYEGVAWIDLSWNGTAVQNIYPYARISAASNGDGAYILYMSDNVSMPEQYGLFLTGLEFNASQRTLQRLAAPPVANEILFDPAVISLPNGTLLVMWDSVSFSEMSNATNPFDINAVLAQYSYFDTQTGSWGPVENITEIGVATSYQLSSDSTGCYALVLEGDSMLSSSQCLVEYDLQNDFELANVSIVNASNVVSFTSLSQLAVLQMIDGSYELLNLSSNELITIPSMSGYQIENVQLAANSTDSLGILYANSASSMFSIYDVSSNTSSFSMSVPQSTSGFTLIKGETDYHLVTSDSDGVTSYVIGDQGLEASLLYPMQNVTLMGSTATNDGMLVYTTENYGNATDPALNLTLTLIPDIVVRNITATPTVITKGHDCEMGVSIANEGDSAETFNVTVCATAKESGNSTVVCTFTNVTLNGHDSKTLSFIWDTTGFDPGDYTTSAYVTLVPGQSMPENTLANGAIQIVTPSPTGGGSRNYVC